MNGWRRVPEKKKKKGQKGNPRQRTKPAKFDKGALIFLIRLHKQLTSTSLAASSVTNISVVDCNKTEKK